MEAKVYFDGSVLYSEAFGSVPHIEWDKGPRIESCDGTVTYFIFGYSSDGRKWEGLGDYCLGDLIKLYDINETR